MQYQALYSLLGIQFGGDGRTTFMLPDLRGRAIVGFGQYPGSGQGYAVGQYGGVESVTLSDANLPGHDHALSADAAAAAVPTPGGNYFATIDGASGANALYAEASTGGLIPLNPNAVGSVGGNAAHDNMQPYLALGYWICVDGYYPPRS